MAHPWFNLVLGTIIVIVGIILILPPRHYHYPLWRMPFGIGLWMSGIFHIAECLSTRLWVPFVAAGASLLLLVLIIIVLAIAEEILRKPKGNKIGLDEIH